MVSTLERFLTKIRLDEETGCWVWTAYTMKSGYGQMGVGRRVVYVHRWAYEHFVGPVPDGLHLDHVKDRGCVSRACCNPDHLEPVTFRENIRRGKKPRNRQSERTHCPQGHPYDEENTYRYVGKDGRGERQCRLCRAASDRRQHGRAPLVA